MFVFCLFFVDGTCERPLLFPLAFSRALSLTSKIIIRKTYVTGLLQVNDVIILPTPNRRKARDTDRQSDIECTTTQTQCADALGYKKKKKKE